MNSSTIDYYDKNAADYSANTFGVKFNENQDQFLAYLNADAHILDFGCGSGRDTKYFMKKGFEVSATDGSKSLCMIASNNTGINVKHMLFHELDEIDKYDGVWACASILHLSSPELKSVMKNIHRSLKEKGIFYASFKYGDFEGVQNGRYYTHMTEGRMQKMMDEINLFKLKKIWVSNDARVERQDEKWLNVILEKK